MRCCLTAISTKILVQVFLDVLLAPENQTREVGLSDKRIIGLCGE